jgi:hypothetical protein
MTRLVHTVALGAALVAVLSALWGDYGVLVALKRAGIAYLVFYCLSALLALVYRAGVLAETRVEAEEGDGASPGGRDGAAGG